MTLPEPKSSSAADGESVDAANFEKWNLPI
jgi:hypothetical protein